MKLLAIETACASCSAAIWAEGTIGASDIVDMARGQAEALMPMVQNVIQRSGISFDALDLIAVSVGPGSFTGLRTGLAAARGIALARGLPILGVTTLQAVALAARRVAPDELARWPITVVLESRRVDLYVQHFDADLDPASAPFAALPDEIAAGLPEGPVLLAGDAAVRIPAADANARRFMETGARPDAVFVAEIAASRWATGTAGAAGTEATPLYLRPPEAKRPVAGGRLRP